LLSVSAAAGQRHVAAETGWFALLGQPLSVSPVFVPGNHTYH
jgi:hypothetical protein